MGRTHGKTIADAINQCPAILEHGFSIGSDENPNFLNMVDRFFSHSAEHHGRQIRRGHPDPEEQGAEVTQNGWHLADHQTLQT